MHFLAITFVALLTLSVALCDYDSADHSSHSHRRRSSDDHYDRPSRYYDDGYDNYGGRDGYGRSANNYDNDGYNNRQQPQVVVNVDEYQKDSRGHRHHSSSSGSSSDSSD